MIYFCQSVLEEVPFFSGILRWIWLILAISLRVVGGLLREPDSLDRAIDIWDLGGVVHAIDNAAFLRGYADPFKLLVGCCMDSIFSPTQTQSSIIIHLIVLTFCSTYVTSFLLHFSRNCSSVKTTAVRK